MSEIVDEIRLHAKHEVMLGPYEMLRRWADYVEQLEAKLETITCAYCGLQYSVVGLEPEAKAVVVMDHACQCPDRPERMLLVQIAQLEARVAQLEAPQEIDREAKCQE